MLLNNAQYHVTELQSQFMIFALFYTLFSPNAYKDRLFWIVLRITFFICKTQSSEPIFNVKFGCEDDEVKYYQEGDLIIGGVFTLTSATRPYVEKNTQILYCMV